MWCGEGGGAVGWDAVERGGVGWREARCFFGGGLGSGTRVR